MNHKLYSLIVIFIISAMLLSGGNLVTAQNPVISKQAPKPTHPETDTTLDLCMSNEPNSLYIYAESQTIWQAQILSAVYDGPMDNHSYSHQPVIFESVPTLDNGQATTETVTVTQGDMIMDSSGWSVVPLEIGTSYFPSGCYQSTCAITYTGGLVEMEHLLVTDTLKSGLTWSDGHPLTSEDILYSFNLNADPATPAYKSQVERTSSYVTTTLTQTVWTGLPGYFPYDYSAIYWTPLPEHVWSAFTPAELISATVSSRTPLGWGAYVIDEWVAGSHISMHKNPLYFRTGEGLPHFDNLLVHFGTELGGILSGSCDVVVSSWDDLGTLLGYDDAGMLDVITSPSALWESLDFGIQSSDVYTGFAALTDAFQDMRVRQAFAYCIDRQAIADEIYHGLGDVPNAFIPDDHPYFPLDATIYPHDPAQGKALLNAAGWVDSNGDSTRDQGGVEFSINLKTTTLSFRYTITSMIAAQMAACGIQVIPIHMPAGEFFAGWPDGPLNGRKFDLAEFKSGGYNFPPCAEYQSWNIPTDDIPYGNNYTGYANPEYDVACSKALGSLTEADRVVKYREVTRLFTQELPALSLFWAINVGITAPHITGFSLDPTEYTFWNIEELSTGVEQVIPPEGGVLTSTEDTTSYAFPSGTFTDTVVITHTPLSPVVLPGFGELAGAGHFFSLEATLDGQPMQPTQPYTMTISYTNAELGFVMEDTVGLYYLNGETWVNEPSEVVDTLTNTIVATPDHFSNWAVLGVPYKLIYAPIITR